MENESQRNNSALLILGLGIFFLAMIFRNNLQGKFFFRIGEQFREFWRFMGSSTMCF